ncbi:hypothetical protein J5N97_029367 [Dioscorea zingiberensis]|uniref:Neprosin PEP catalytic domain-containing protein n=1 Tax=Dioscorea zingiberensis TaxID=325984 RepID=A0A9D5H5T8_9LILI|nr:hypothetical protein J5N97_029367 [Dioscorea zingiberensis]
MNEGKGQTRRPHFLHSYCLTLLLLGFRACLDGVLSKELFQSIQQEGIQKMNSIYGIMTRNLTSESCTKDSDNTITHWAVYKSRKGYRQGFYGTKATMSVYALQNVTQNQLTSADIWIINGLDGPPENTNAIVVGWTEKNSGNWWLYYGASGNYDKLVPVGYWPKSLFTGLAGYASDIHYGGVVDYVKGQHGPPMGSGHFADEGENKAASFTRIQEVDQDGNASDHIEAEFKVVQDKRECYTATKFRDNSFFFGGPGGQQCTD